MFSEPVAPLYPPQWLQKRMMTSVMRYQEFIDDMVGNIDQDKVSDEDSNDDLMRRSTLVTANHSHHKVSKDNNVDDENKNIEIEDDTNREMHAMACNLHVNLSSQKKGESHQTWWQRATEGILVWQSSRKMCLILES